MESLLPVVVGGLIGLAGGIVGPPLTHWLNDGSTKKKKRADKLEEMLGTLYQHHHWLSTIRSIRMFGKEAEEQLPPLPKAQAIGAIYFPQFSDRLRDLEGKSDAYEIWMLKAGQKRMAGKMDEMNDGFDDVYRPYAQEFASVVAALKEHAQAESLG